MCHHTQEPTVLSRVSCHPFHLIIDRFHQPCLLPGRTSRMGEAVVPVPRGGHLPFWWQPGSSSFASHWWFLPRRLDGTTGGRFLARLPLHVPPATLGVSTHAGSGPSRVRRRLLRTCPGHGPHWHLGSEAVFGVWRSLITCGDVCSDVTEVHAFSQDGSASLQDHDKVEETLFDWERGIVHCVLTQHLSNLSNHSYN